MRIGHVVTLISSDGSFGGPMSVAAQHVSELRKSGHEAILLGGRYSADKLAADSLQSISPLALFPTLHAFGVKKLSTLVPFGLLAHLVVNRRAYDILHIHLGRDLTTQLVAFVARRLKIPYVVQTHGMIAPDARLLIRIYDWALTRRSLKSAGTVFFLTERERTELTQVAPGLDHLVSELPNGISLKSEGPYHKANTVPKVLFCSRLHQRKRPLEFVRTARWLLDRGYRAKFVLAGPDQGEAERVQSAIHELDLTSHVQYVGSVRPENVSKLLGSADILLLPSVDEPFPMVVLEALRDRLPVVITNQNGLATALRNGLAGLVSEPDHESMGRAVALLLDDPSLGDDLRERGHRLLRDHLSIESVAKQLLLAYEGAA